MKSGNTTEVQISTGKYILNEQVNLLKLLLKYRSADRWRAAARQTWPYVLFLLFYIQLQLVFLRTETKKNLKHLLCSNFKLKKELLLVSELCSFIRKTASIFLDTYSLGLFHILFQMHSFF